MAMVESSVRQRPIRVAVAGLRGDGDEASRIHHFEGSGVKRYLTIFALLQA
jgi:hypothetical protein